MLQRNPRLLCIFHALQMSLFPMAILTVFYRQNLGMSMAEIMLVQGGFGLVMALVEFPSGYLADRIGYRRTLVIGAILEAVGWSLYARADGIGGVILGEAVLGVGLSLISGCDAALLYESLTETGREFDYGRWSGRVRFWGQLGEGSAALVAGVMFAYWARLPFVTEAVIWVVNLLVAWLQGGFGLVMALVEFPSGPALSTHVGDRRAEAVGWSTRVRTGSVE